MNNTIRKTLALVIVSSLIWGQAAADTGIFQNVSMNHNRDIPEENNFDYGFRTGALGFGTQVATADTGRDPLAGVSAVETNTREEARRKWEECFNRRMCSCSCLVSTLGALCGLIGLYTSPRDGHPRDIGGDNIIWAGIGTAIGVLLGIGVAEYYLAPCGSQP